MTPFVSLPRRSALRWLLAPAALVAAAAHVPVIGPHLDEAPYMGVLFIVLTVGCSALAAAALVRDSAAVYALSIVTCGLAILGYAATRIVAFPMLSDDVGNWFEPLGIVSIGAESVVVASAITELRRRSAYRVPGRVLLSALAACGITLGLLAGCSSSAKSTQPGTGHGMPTSMSASGPSSSASAPASEAMIHISGFKYVVPASVSAGETVHVMNMDSENHTVTADSSGAFDVRAIAGSTATFTAPSKPGSYPFHCTYHASMHGVLVVR